MFPTRRFIYNLAVRVGQSLVESTLGVYGKRQEAGLLTVIGRIHNPHASMGCALHSACLGARVYMSLAGFAHPVVMPSQFLNGRLGMDRASSPAAPRLE